MGRRGFERFGQGRDKFSALVKEKINSQVLKMRIISSIPEKCLAAKQIFAPCLVIGLVVCSVV
jgi:hypothetical protein